MNLAAFLAASVAMVEFVALIVLLREREIARKDLAAANERILQEAIAAYRRGWVEGRKARNNVVELGRRQLTTTRRHSEYPGPDAAA